MQKYFFYAATLLTLANCGKPSQQASKIDGHYENSSAQQMEAFRNQQFAVPEYGPVSRVVVAYSLIDFGREDLIAEIFATGVKEVIMAVPMNEPLNFNNARYDRLKQVLGANINKVKLVNKKVDGDVTVWARDWAPLGALDNAGNMRLVDFNYYSTRQADDSSAQALGGVYGFERVSVPVYNEGGNFMHNDSGHCMMTKRVSEANARRDHPEDMILNDQQITDYYKGFAGCKKVTIFPRLPHEGTGHIDMWAKFLDDKTVLVSEMTNESVALTPAAGRTRKMATDIQAFLNTRATEIAAMGYNVVRIPMPVPESVRFEGESFDSDIFRSYTNSLTSNGTAIIPRYLKLAEQIEYDDASKLAEYEAKVTAAYSKFGYKVRWVDSDMLIAYGGAVHCVTMQLAK